MCCKSILDTVGALGLPTAVIAVLAIYYSYKSNRQLIITNKLEELFQTVIATTMYYDKLIELFNALDTRNKGISNDLKTYNDYFAVRDRLLPKDEQMRIIADLYRIEVLAKCYTNQDLRHDILKFHEWLKILAHCVITGSNGNQQLKFKNGFPNYEEFYAEVERLKNGVLKQIN